MTGPAPKSVEEDKFPTKKVKVELQNIARVGSGLSVKNTGASWLVMLPSEGSSLTGGAIPGQFKVDFKSLLIEV